jgi:hypothetical protein
MRKTLIWVGLLILTLVLQGQLHQQPALTEQYYTQKIFVGIRWFLDTLNAGLPIPAFYIVVALLLFFWGKNLRYWAVSPDSKRTKLQKTAHQFLRLVCGVVVFFYWFWGFNYARQPIEEQLKIPAVTLNDTTLRHMLDAQTLLVDSLRMTLQPDTAAMLDQFVPPDALETTVRDAVHQHLTALGLPAPGRPRGRAPFWNGFLLRFGAAGVYNPFTGECNIDPGLPALTKPYTLAHEFCHGYGFADEGTCNFLAYLALSVSPDAPLRYAAELAFWRELAGAYSRAQPEAYKQIWQSRPGGFQKDILHIRATINQYPEFFEAFRVKAYDHYLKAQGIEEGIKNYGTVVRLVAGYRGGR